MFSLTHYSLPFHHSRATARSEHQTLKCEHFRVIIFNQQQYLINFICEKKFVIRWCCRRRCRPKRRSYKLNARLWPVCLLFYTHTHIPHRVLTLSRKSAGAMWKDGGASCTAHTKICHFICYTPSNFHSTHTICSVRAVKVSRLINGWSERTATHHYYYYCHTTVHLWLWLTNVISALFSLYKFSIRLRVDTFEPWGFPAPAFVVWVKGERGSVWKSLSHAWAVSTSSGVERMKGRRQKQQKKTFLTALEARNSARSMGKFSRGLAVRISITTTQ